MPAISLKAHFDGEVIRLDEPFELPRDAQLIVTVLSPAGGNSEMPGWYDLSASGLAGAYGANEPEYSAADILP